MTNWTRQIHGIPEIIDAIYDGRYDVKSGADRVLTILHRAGGVPEDVMQEFIDVHDVADNPTAHFDFALEKMYDWADEECVWISPTRGAA